MENLRGAALMVFAMFGFAVEDMLIKQMAADLPVGQVVIVLGIGGAIIFGSIATYYGMGAALFLGETVGWRRWMAIAVGLVGVLLIIRPGLQGFDAKSLLAVMGVIGLAARDLATRRIPAVTSSRVITFYAFSVSILTGWILLQLGVTGDVWITPDTGQRVQLGLAVIVGVVAYYAIVAATRIGEMSVIAPFRYSRLVFALIIGVMVFEERPDALTLLGALIIVASGIYTLWRESRLSRAFPSGTGTV